MLRVPRHVILLSVDDLRFDALSSESEKTYLRSHGLENLPSTPNIDRFAIEGFRFSGCRVTAPRTTPSHASLLTGLYPPRHGLRPFVHRQLAASARTLFERFREAGFEPLAGIDYLSLFRFTDLTRGASLLPPGEDAVVAQEFENHDRRGHRVFLFLHAGDVHFPYGLCNAPAQAKDNLAFIRQQRALARRLGLKLGKNHGRAQDLSLRVREAAQRKGLAVETGFPAYLNGVNRYDRLRFARLFRMLGSKKLLEDTLVVITSDHGEGPIAPERLAERTLAKGRMRFDHMECVTEELLRVPLIFWHGGGAVHPGAHAQPVSSVDITPTLLRLCGIPFRADELDGVDRSSLVRGVRDERVSRAAKEASPCYAEVWYENQDLLREYVEKCVSFMTLAQGSDSFAGGIPEPPHPQWLHQQTIRSGACKLLVTHGRRGKARFSLHDLDQDPFEQVNLLARPLKPHLRELVRELKSALDRRAAAGPAARRPKRRPTKDEMHSLETQLRSLGYLG